MQVIIFHQIDGTVAVLFPAPEYADQLEAVGNKDVPAGCSWRMVETSDLPSSPQETWIWTNDGPLAISETLAYPTKP